MLWSEGKGENGDLEDESEYKNIVDIESCGREDGWHVEEDVWWVND